MTELALGRDRVRRRERIGAATSAGTDARRVLQLILAATWLLDGMLRYQSFMYTKAFGQMIGGSAAAGPRAGRSLADGPPAVAVGQAEGNEGRPEGKFA